VRTTPARRPARGGDAPRPARPVTVLIYDAVDAPRYARLIAPQRDVAIRVASTRDEAVAAIGEAEVAFAWKIPPDVWRHAHRLRWFQTMGAGVDWALVPTLPRDVVVTRAPGVFGPWMVEYVLAWCLWVTQQGPPSPAPNASGAGWATSSPDVWAVAPWRWSAWATSAAPSRAVPAPSA
jgi:phosphoglycerate dehydrogenase-like enzyme